MTLPIAGDEDLLFAPLITILGSSRKPSAEKLVLLQCTHLGRSLPAENETENRCPQHVYPHVVQKQLQDAQISQLRSYSTAEMACKAVLYSSSRHMALQSFSIYDKEFTTRPPTKTFRRQNCKIGLPCHFLSLQNQCQGC